MTRYVSIALLGVALGARTAIAADPDPVVSLWYRGQPAGVPRAEDLDEIRAAGFSGVTWPIESAPGVGALTRLAEAAGLAVVVRPGSAKLTAASALKGSDLVDVDVTMTPTATVTPIVWRAIAHGARAIAFDPGRAAGTGLVDRKGRPLLWAAAGADIARQLRINGGLIAQCRPGPAVTIDQPVPEALDVVLLDAGKSWVLMATNTSRSRARAVVHLPARVPYALWLNLLNGSALAMLHLPAGPTWNLDIEAWGVRVEVIDKVLR